MPAEDNQINLYLALVDQIQKYNSIVWQAPTALLAANILALDKFSSNPFMLLVLSIFNATLIFAFYKMVAQQRTIIDASKAAEEILKATWPNFVPQFKKSKVSAPHLFVWTMGLLNLVLFVKALLDTINK